MVDMRTQVRRLIRRIRPRSFTGFIVGNAKTGTSSLHAMFRGAYRSAHEPEAEMLIPVVSDLLRGRTDVAIEEFLTKRDARLRLELESSSPLVPVVPHLVRLFPDARFVLTARDPRSWFASQASHVIRNNEMRGTFWQLWREARFAGHEFSNHDQPLRDAGLYPLAGFLSWWTRHNQIVLDAVPPERLLIVKTNDIGPRGAQIASFLAPIPARSASRTRTC